MQVLIFFWVKQNIAQCDYLCYLFTRSYQLHYRQIEIIWFVTRQLRL